MAATLPEVRKEGAASTVADRVVVVAGWVEVAVDEVELQEEAAAMGVPLAGSEREAATVAAQEARR